MKGKQRLYIAYGSNLNLEQMAFRCPTAKVVGKSELKDYELLFRGGRRGAVATVEPKAGSTVPVLVWEIQKKYDKQMLEIELDGKIVPAMVYVMTPGHSFGIPSDYYSNVIWQGYETAGFETQFLEDAIEHAYQLVQKQEREGGFYQQSLFHMGGYDGMK